MRATKRERKKTKLTRRLDGANLVRLGGVRLPSAVRDANVLRHFIYLFIACVCVREKL